MRLLGELKSNGFNPNTYAPYDPAFPEYGLAQPADLVCCIDVLEHIEPELIKNVISHLSSLVLQFGFFTIHTGAAKKTLPDGRNAHLIQKPSSWWLSLLIQYFEIEHLQNVPNGFIVLVSNRYA